MSEHFLGSKKGFEILANLGLDPLPLEMITTRKVRAVSNGGGDLKCLNITSNVFTLLFVAG
jgi:hypothetical protein